MKEVNVSSELLEKTAQFVQHAAPQLEKQAAEKQAWDQQCPIMVDAMINAGVLQASNREQAITGMKDGGITKAAELIPFLAGKIGAPIVGRPIEKQASAERGPKVRESDTLWMDAFGQG